MRGINSPAATWNNRVCKVDYNEAKPVASQVCGGRVRHCLEQFGIGICGVNDLNGRRLGSIKCCCRCSRLVPAILEAWRWIVHLETFLKMAKSVYMHDLCDRIFFTLI